MRPFGILTLCVISLVSFSTPTFGQEEDQSDQLKKQLEAAHKRINTLLKEADAARKHAEEAAARAKAEARKAAFAESQAIGKLSAEFSRAKEASSLVKSALEKVGAKHAYTTAMRDNLLAQRTALAIELEQHREMFGQGHPKLKELQAQLNFMDAHLATMEPSKSTDKPGKSKDAVKNDVVEKQHALELEARATLLKALEKSMLGGESSGVAKELLEKLQSDYAKIKTEHALVAQKTAEALLKQRAEELMQMQQKLKQAEQLRYQSFKTKSKPDAMEPTEIEKRFDKIETRLDRIAGLLEKLVEKDAKRADK